MVKESLYNSRISVSEQTDLLYNAMSGRFMLVRKDAKISCDASSKYYVRLCDGGFLVDDEIDELSILKRKSSQIDNMLDPFHLIINPTLMCNFKCWYCYEEKRQNAIMDDLVIQRIKILINQLSLEHGALSISFFGGEPLLCFDNIVVPLIDHASSVCADNGCKLVISFTTNGFLLNQERINYLRGTNVIQLQITLDGNRTLHNRTRYISETVGSYDRILDNIASLAKNALNVLVRLNYTDNNILSLKEVPNDFISRIPFKNRKYVAFSFHQVWQNTSVDLHQEISELISYYEEMGLNARQPVFNNVNSPCYGDRRSSVIINFNGDLFKCTAVDFLNESREGYLNEFGKLIWENDNLNDRLNSKFHNIPCLSCRISPICNGGCSQKALAYSGHSYCIQNFSDKKRIRLF